MIIDPELFDVRELLQELLGLGNPRPEPGHEWRGQCEIIPNYMPPYPRPDTRARCVVQFAPSGMFLRHSSGPRQGHFWDIYGDDYLRPSIALRAILEAPPPPRLADGSWFKGYLEFKIPLRPEDPK